MRTTRIRRGGLVAGLTALALVAGACGGSSKNGSTSSNSGSSNTTQAALGAATLNESGSTFQLPYLQEVAKDFKSVQGAVTVNVNGGGSGKGRQDLADQVTDFAAADGLPKPNELAGYKGGALLYFPTVASPITVSYNASGVDKLQLDGATIAKIFQRQIKTWDDPAIAALNSGAKLPSKAITVAHRSDSSGTTQNFTTYLQKAAPSSWTIGAGSTVNWPADTQAGNGNAGVAQIVKSTDGAIGYVDYSDAKALGLKFADIKNAAGKFVMPSLDGTSAALEQATVNADLSYDPLDAPGDATYPIATPTWIIAYKNQTDRAKGAALKSFLQYIYGPGQDKAADVDYAKLSPNILDKAKAQLDTFLIPA